jgi:phosphotransferase system enzyme I (PtsI)
VQALKGGPVTIRTLDLGADKPIPYFMQPDRPGLPPNPALGLRAIRMCLKDLPVFKAQLRAIVRASRLGTVRILLPMISSLHEFYQVRQLLKEVQEELSAQKIKYDPNLSLGVMVEVPSVAICADLYAPHFDFMSIGTNDLIQYTMAIDRGDDEVNYLYDPLHPAVLRLLKMSIQAATKAAKPISMCGEMAGDVRYVRLLLGLGLRAFSVNPESLLEVKRIINTTRIGSLNRLTAQAFKCHNRAEIRELVEKMNKGIRQG